MAFFTRVFGFEEESYSTTKKTLLDASSFQTVTEADLGLWRIWQDSDGTLHPNSVTTKSWVDGGCEDATLARTSSMLFSESEHSGTRKELRAIGERCVISMPRVSAAERDAAGHSSNVQLHAGVFTTPSVNELRDRVRRLVTSLTPFEKQEMVRMATATFGRPSLLSMSSVIGDSREMHSDLEHENGVFQAASQFNYLEFCGPQVTPEEGIAGYVFDRTQGPACACACAAGTAYRNYLATLPDGCRGQTAKQQLNGLADITKFLTGSDDGESTEFYTVRNGYVESSDAKLRHLNKRLANTETFAQLVGMLRVGVQEDTQVTDERAGCVQRRFVENGKVRFRYVPIPEKQPFLVNQVYCSALSVGYSRTDATLWEPFACLVLRGTYEATLLLSIINTIKHLRRGTFLKSGGMKTLPLTLLTKVGGGVFGNNKEWIQRAIVGATESVIKQTDRLVPLNVRVVHYGWIEAEYDVTCRACEQIGGSMSVSKV